MAVIRFMSSGLNGIESRCNGHVFSTTREAMNEIVFEELSGRSRDGKQICSTIHWVNEYYRELLQESIEELFKAAEKNNPRSWDTIKIRLNPIDDEKPVYCDLLMLMY